MQLIMEIEVEIKEIIEVKGGRADVVMISFDGKACGPNFEGKVIGSGVDTQKIPAGREPYLSARYMLEGKDSAGQSCRIFIENNGSAGKGFIPWVITDSSELLFLEKAELSAEVCGREGGVLIRIWNSSSNGDQAPSRESDDIDKPFS